MVAAIGIPHGTPIWDSQAIVPSRDTVVSPSSRPAVAAISINSTGIFVYVKVDNTGNVDLGACSCAAAVPAAWPQSVLFPGFHANPNTSTSETRFGVTFTARPSTDPLGDSLSGAVNFSFGIVAANRRAWAWSPDGRFFAHVSSFSGNDWHLTIIALQTITRSDGTMVVQGQRAVSGAQGLFAGPWSSAQFGWAGSRAVIAAGMAQAAGQIARSVSCPEAPGNNTWGDLVPDFPAQVGWTHLSSPCGSVVALVPRILQAGVASRVIQLVSTATARPTEFRRNNALAGVYVVGSAPSISTLQHAAQGVRVNTGSGAFEARDDPECTGVVGGGVNVAVDRMAASTVLGGNLGVMAVGTATQGLLAAGQSQWVQVPNANGWANQSERHWCLLAQAFTVDGTTIQRPWNGQATSPPPFPSANQNCAQRNIEISP